MMPAQGWAKASATVSAHKADTQNRTDINYDCFKLDVGAQPNEEAVPRPLLEMYALHSILTPYNPLSSVDVIHPRRKSQSQNPINKKAPNPTLPLATRPEHPTAFSPFATGLG